jgi:hypothetical protein
MQHRRFAGPRRADQCDDLAGAERQVDRVQDDELDPALAKRLAHRAQFERRPFVRLRASFETRLGCRRGAPQDEVGF